MVLYGLLLIGQALVNPILIIFGWAVGWIGRRGWQLVIGAALVAPLIELTWIDDQPWDSTMLARIAVNLLAILAWATGTFLIARRYARPGPISAERRGQLVALCVCLVAGAGISILGANTAIAAGRKLAQWLDVDEATSSMILATAEPYGMLLFMLLCGALGWVLAGRVGRRPETQT